MQSESTRLKILIVEDDDNIAELLAVDFEQEGFEVVRRQTFYGCGEEMRRPPLPALIVLDLGLGDSSPYETLGKIPDLAAYEVPIVVVTGHGDEVIRKLALGKGAKGYRAKPFGDIEGFVAEIKEIIRRDRVDKSLTEISSKSAQYADELKQRLLMNGSANGK